MTDDQEFILAMIGVVTSAIGSAAVYLRTNQVHGLVNGIGKANMRRARQAGKKAGVATERASSTPIPLHPTEPPA